MMPHLPALLTDREAALAVLAFLAGMGGMAWVRRVADGVWL